MEGTSQAWNAIWIALFPTSYLMGAIPFGRLISQRVAKIDITQRGSGNIGATNVARELGVKWGLLTLILDVLKGLVPVVVFRMLFPASPFGLGLVGLCALLGHQFTPFLRFRGGKGVATALGAYLAVSPLSCLGALVVFVLVVYKWDFISLGSMIAACSMPIFLVLSGKPWGIILISLVMAGFVCLKHRDNISRLTAGNERKWRSKARVQEAK